MSDLQCPARILLARHAEAEYESELMLDHGGSLTPRGRRQARALGERLRDERVAHVYTSTMSRAVQTGELAAAVLKVEVTVREGLAETGAGHSFGEPADLGLYAPVVEAWLAGDGNARLPGAESGSEITQRVRAVLDDLADVHRGETVLVVSHGAAMLATLSALAYRPGRPDRVDNCSHLVLEGDADGWRLVTELAPAPSNR